MKTFLLERQQELSRPPGEVFPFFAEARNLERITPPLLGFEILTEGEIAMGVGTLIDYRIRLHRIPIRWRTRISAWNPPHSFVDEQIRGPYRLWIHEHRFDPTPTGGTRMWDRVRYAVPGGWLAERWFVRPRLEQIFDYRRDQVEEWLADLTDVVL